MDIHKPKSWHNVREFLKEYVIIVVGVLTALGAEQGVEWLHWRHEVAAAEAAFRKELHQDGLNARIVVASWPCEQKRLDELSAALRHTTGLWKGQAADMQGRRSAFLAPGRGWPEASWEEYKGNGAVQHMADDERRRFNALYFRIGFLQRWNDDQGQASAELAILADDLTLTDATRDRELAAIERARFDGYYLNLVGEQVLADLGKAGVTLADTPMGPTRTCEARFTNTPAAAGR